MTEKCRRRRMRRRRGRRKIRRRRGRRRKVNGERRRICIGERGG